MWLKFRVWTKVILFVLVTLYVLVFVLKNMDERVSLWVWINYRPDVAALIFIPAAFLFGVITTLLVRTIFRTLGQIREMKRKRAEKEAAIIVARAAKLRVRAENGEAAV
jgi:uncharacterized integral membrane protein